MANADTLATLVTKDTGQRKRKQKNTTQKTTKMSNTYTFVNRR
jgi:dolichol kinase